MASASGSGGKRRKQEHLVGLTASPSIGRMAIANHYNRKVAQLAGNTNFPELAAFLPQNLWPWLSKYLKFAVTPKHPFPTYKDTAKNGVYPISSTGPDGITFAIAGDWGTGTHEAATIAYLMASKHPDWTIHLGDVYYVGDESEIHENCLGVSAHGFTGVTWPHGSQGSFALNGNHEMYANGKAYFTTFLSTLGPKGDPHHQIASFFCLEAEHWRVIGIDTAYNSVGVPILGQIPWIKNIPAIGGDCHLQNELVAWLRDVVKPQNDSKANLLLSHHQYFSAFKDQGHPKPAQQMAEFFKGKEVVWIWGHEHRFALYDKFSPDGSITAYARCMGHSGMPTDVGVPDPAKAPIRFYDARRHSLQDGSEVGENGYLLASIKGETLTLDYRDINDQQLLTERFTRSADGVLGYECRDRGILRAVSAGAKWTEAG